MTAHLFGPFLLCGLGEEILLVDTPIFYMLNLRQ